MPVQHRDKPVSTRLPIGAFATWMAHTYGKQTAHSGSICAFVPRNTSVRSVLPRNTTAAQLRTTMFMSQRDRYLVREAITLADRPLKFIYYTTQASVLEYANPQSFTVQHALYPSVTNCSRTCWQ